MHRIAVLGAPLTSSVVRSRGKTGQGESNGGTQGHHAMGAPSTDGLNTPAEGTGSRCGSGWPRRPAHRFSRQRSTGPAGMVMTTPTKALRLAHRPTSKGASRLAPHRPTPGTVCCPGKRIGQNYDVANARPGGPDDTVRAERIPTWPFRSADHHHRAGQRDQDPRTSTPHCPARSRRKAR